MPYLYEGSAATLVPYLQVLLTTELSVPPIFFSPNVLGALAEVLDNIDSHGPASAFEVGPADDYQDTFDAHEAGDGDDFFEVKFELEDHFCSVSVNYVTKTVVVTNEEDCAYPEGQAPYAVLLTLP